ncbi:MAG: Fibronectin type III domain-containing protein [Candidatus Kentron sp. G]|nr:MAG: Fibronectin type III domain-containing protein [Candidatus Kentron sp. G]VFN00924.1 MAG: Fibronectin type III domain-containing protein [Candidatus Kentron sp. G]
MHLAIASGRARFPPGRTRDLRIKEQGEGWITLYWEKPADGGKVTAYKVVFRERGVDNDDWNNEGTSLTTELTLTGQPQGKELEYAVVAMNKAGEGEMSNTVIATL